MDFRRAGGNDPIGNLRAVLNRSGPVESWCARTYRPALASRAKTRNFVIKVVP